MYEEFADLSTRRLLDKLPPVRYAPILQHLGRLGLENFKKFYAIPTPTHENGIVDHKALIARVNELVSPEYRWRAPFFDEHHLHWKKRYYNPGLHGGDQIPEEFRDLPIHTLWIPREVHDFIHVVTNPSDVPENRVMHTSVRDYRIKHYLFKITGQAIELRERNERSVPLPGDEDRMRDPIDNRIIDTGRYEQRRQEFVAEIIKHFQNGMPPDLTSLSSLSLEEANDIDPVLIQLRKGIGDAIVHSKNKRRGRPVQLPIDTQTIERPARAA